MFDRSTDFQILQLRVDGKDIKEIFFALEIFEHIDSSAITGVLTVVETASNQFLATYGIEGNETIEIQIRTPADQYLVYHGYVNRVADRTVTSNGQSVYNLEFVSPLIRANEQIQVTKKYKEEKPVDIVTDIVEQFNVLQEIPVQVDRFEGKGQPMTFLASLWHPMKALRYVMKYGVPYYRGGVSSAQDGFGIGVEEAGGTGGFLFWETLKGLRFGSSIELMNGMLGEKSESKFKYTLANKNDPPSVTRDFILSYNNVQNNDTQAQQRTGAVKSTLITFDMDQGVYREQVWESPFATEKQKKSNLLPTRTFVSTLSPEVWSKECTPRGINVDDQTLMTVQQYHGTVNNIVDNVCQFTLPIRIDLSVGDMINTTIYKTSVGKSDTIDEKYSGNWIVSGVAHHFLLETGAAYSRLTCIRNIDQVDDLAEPPSLT